MSTDYSTSKYENAAAERFHEAALDGFTAVIYDSDGTAIFEASTVDGETAILRYDSQGFVWVEYGPTTFTGPDSPLQRHWDYLEREYAADAR